MLISDGLQTIIGALLWLTQRKGPRLRSGGYAAWKVEMDVFLERHGAAGVHHSALTEADWLTRAARVQQWGDEALAAALALELSEDGTLSGATGSSSTVQVPQALSAERKAARELITEQVKRSRRVYGVLYSALPEDLRAQAAHIKQGFAYGLWHWLEQKFQGTEQDRVGELFSQWTSLRQEEDESFDAYRARVDELDRELTRAKEQQSRRMYSFMLLDRLQPRYKQAVLALKAGDQLKDADKVDWSVVASFLNSHERSEQRIGAAEGSVEGQAHSAIAAGADMGKASGAWRKAGGGGGGGAGRKVRFDQGRGEGAVPRSSPRSFADVQCFNCHQYGHFRGDCPQPRKQRGAPGGARSPGSPRSPPRARSPGAGGEQASVAMRSNRYGALSSDEEQEDEQEARARAATKPLQHSYVAMVMAGLAGSSAASSSAAAPVAKKRLVRNSVLEQRKPAPAAKPAAEAPAAARLEQAKQVPRTEAKDRAAVAAPKPGKGVKLDAALADDAWGWDTMASTHCSGNRDRFITLRKCPGVPVRGMDGNIVMATHCGSVALRFTTDSGRNLRLVVDNVLFHERFAANLLSSHLLTGKGGGWQFHSGDGSTFVVTPGGNKVTLNTGGRVSVLMGAGPERVYASHIPGTRRTVSDGADSLVRLHERLNHMGFAEMLKLLKNRSLVDLPQLSFDEKDVALAQERLQQCRACMEGKGTRTPFGHRGLDRGLLPCECLHFDSFQVRVERDFRSVVEYGLAATDMHSRHRWFSKLDSKDLIPSAVIAIVRNAQTQYNCRVKRIYADGGSEFINSTVKEFCRKEGIELHWTPARTQQLNGAAERAVRAIKDQERTLLRHAGAPVQFWQYAALHSTFVWNRSHVAEATGVTPYEALRGKKPSAQHWGVFGCDAYMHVPKQQCDALDAKMEPCIYLGHDSRQDAASVFVLRTGKIICSRDVVYNMRSFSHCRALLGGEEQVKDVVDAAPRQGSGAGNAHGDDSVVYDSDSVPAQGGQGRIDEQHPTAAARSASPSLSSSSSSTVSSEEKEDDDEEDDAEPEYKVKRILRDRPSRRGGGKEYKVRWEGYTSKDDTWEPEANLENNSVLHDWLAEQIARRQSTRLRPEAQPTTPSALAASPSAASSAADSIGAEHEDAEPQVHMAMCALRGMQVEEERPDAELVAKAIASGIALLEEQTPTTYRQAMASPEALKWKEALDKEMKSCEDLKVWSLVKRSDLPRGANVLPCKEVFKVKVDEHGEIEKHKARVTPKGFRQRYGVDYNETFARTGQYKTLRVHLSLVAKWDHELVQLDVPSAFLHADLEEDVYMELPEGYEQPGMVCKLHKSLYGLKQSPRNWDKLAHAFLTGDMGFKATVSDPSLYFRRSRSGRLMMIYRFVDDMQGSHHAEDAEEFKEHLALLQRRFDIKSLGKATWMLGMRITRDRKARTITLDQELYVTKALERYGLTQCRIVSTPEAVGAADAPADPVLDAPTDTQRYMEMVGTLMYAGISSRPDIQHAVHYLASHMQTPKHRHMLAAERVLRYLAGTKEVGLVFGARNGSAVGDSRGRATQVQVDVCAFADADWANGKGDRKSISGWVAKLNGDPVSWASKKQRVVALSTCEAELYAEAAAIQEVLWLRGLMQELGLYTQTGSVVYGDNQSAIAVSHNGVRSERTKHVDVKYHFITETVEQGAVKLKWVPTTEQQADIFTKALHAPVFELLRKQLMTR